MPDFLTCYISVWWFWRRPCWGLLLWWATWEGTIKDLFYGTLNVLRIFTLYFYFKHVSLQLDDEDIDKDLVDDSFGVKTPEKVLARIFFNVTLCVLNSSTFYIITYMFFSF